MVQTRTTDSGKNGLLDARGRARLPGTALPLPECTSDRSGVRDRSGGGARSNPGPARVGRAGDGHALMSIGTRSRRLDPTTRPSSASTVAHKGKPPHPDPADHGRHRAADAGCREIWGFPKKLAAIAFRRERDMIFGTLERAGRHQAGERHRPPRAAAEAGAARGDRRQSAHHSRGRRQSERAAGRRDRRGRRPRRRYTMLGREPDRSPSPSIRRWILGIASR